MSSPPPSETGATAEAAQIIADWIKAPWVRDPVPPGRDPREGAVGILAMTREHKRDLIQRIDAALQAAKRSAHLEDARGCPRCAAGERPTRYEDSTGWTWSHGPSRLDECARPEAWEALSLLDGKTR